MRYLTLCLLLCANLALPAQQPVISVLGTVHLHNPGRDKVNIDMGDINSPQRQAELARAIDLISEFQPTKIAFEWVVEDTLWSKHYYQAWKNGQLDAVIAEEDRYYLTSEIVQLAYPLARAAGLEELHPIDFHAPFPLDSALTYAANAGQETALADIQAMFGKAQEMVDSMALLPITDILRGCNSRLFCQQLTQTMYLKNIVAIGKGKEYPGSHLVEEWYRRNIRIFTNLHRIVGPQDRVLVIFGAGHKEILDDLIQDRVDWRWYDSRRLFTGDR